VAEARGLQLLCSGTHPFSDWATQEITAKPRYLRLVEEVQWPAGAWPSSGFTPRRGALAGEAIIIANALSAYIPHSWPLSASSPYWMGQGHRPGLEPVKGLRGAAHGRPAPAVSVLAEFGSS